MTQVRPVGDRAVLLEVAGNDDVHRLAAAARTGAHADVLEDVVAGHRTVLLAFRRPPVDPAVVQAVLEAAAAGHDAAPSEERDPVTIAVRYDGPDLDVVARHARMSPEEVARRHAAATYRVAFVGFAPGFAYLVGGDPALHVPRRDDPRERVPAGAVALAGEYSAVYPSASPGGWQLVGSSDVRLFDPSRDPPALLQPGATVRFTA